MLRSSEGSGFLALAAAAIGLAAAFAMAEPFFVGREEPSGEGAIMAVDIANRRLTIAHEPIAYSALRWPGMTMEFSVAPGVEMSAVKPGMKIAFRFAFAVDGGYVIDRIAKED